MDRRSVRLLDPTQWFVPTFLTILRSRTWTQRAAALGEEVLFSGEQADPYVE